ncbi:(d)CMP kinase [Azotosporobacter soli]|uniref:(d)CMP kinase n=1 Tax=Azotosporobacter soli TaxID=3055040 RepID=UPI0031FF0F10
MKPFTIAIDGPAGAGKSTIARLVAAALQYIYIDTGAMYRAVAWKVQAEKIALTNEARIISLVEKLSLRLTSIDGKTRVFADGNDISETIRNPEISRLVPVVAAIAGVRKILLAMQQEMAECGGVVMDGRDIGTAVLPNAEIKIFLTASIEERAKRRWLELTNNGFTCSLEELMQEIAARDKQDYERETAPLRQAEDAVLIDTTGLTIKEVTAAILGVAERRENLV